MTSSPGPMPPLPAPRRRGRGPVWARALGALGLGVAGACVWGVVVVLGAYVSHDPPELIDNPPTVAALETPCAAVQEAAAQVEAAAPTAEQALQLARVVTAIDGLAASVAALPAGMVDADRPTRSWVADWETLGSRIRDYSAALTSGAPVDLDTPVTQDGYTVVNRMDLAAPLGCEVPAVLVALDRTPPPVPSTQE